MFLDARTLDRKRYDFDICIIGAGAAGITLARALRDSKKRLCLLESGGFEPDADTQSLYDGDIVGLPYYPLDSARLRYFGGTTGHWGGCCWPLEENEFKKRDWVPHSGWPFSRKELDPYYVKAQVVCELGPFNYDSEYWSEESDRPILPLADGRVVTKVYQNSPPTRFGNKYREDIETADNISAILHANVTEIALDTLNRTVDKVTVKTLSDNTFDVTAQLFVVATGGLENARLLLLNDIGNQNDLVGRYFMEHIGLPASTLLLPKKINTEFYQRAPADGTEIRAGLGLKPEVLAREKILNSWSGLELKRSAAVKLQYEWKYISTAISEGKLPDNFRFHLKKILNDLRQVYGDKWNNDDGDDEWITIPVRSHSEQSPNPVSRVTLGDELDKLGQRKIKFDWQLTDLDRRSIRRAQEIIAAEIGRSDLGRVQVLAPDEQGVWESPRRLSDVTYPNGSWHHMGTTRMHNNQKHGVVDGNCRVHGTKNLYIAGSSVFPTSGFNNPTLTIVAMAFRMADHLRSLS
ncbi:MAG TPA: GMC family oxidoreductase [Gammaproteobacteria bacterium]|nr:GMC family oxidoreductase [Gammaproteobacteria bacterium]